MTFTGYVEDYRLRDLLRIGQSATILSGARVHVLFPKLEQRSHSLFRGKDSSDAVDPKHLRDDLPRKFAHQEFYTLGSDRTVKVTNFLPGHIDIYADNMGKRETHNHQVVWIEKDGLEYHSTDLNNVKEIQDAK